MGVFVVRRGKAEYLYVKNKAVSEYIRVTDGEGNRLSNYAALRKRAEALNDKHTTGTGTPYLYLVRAANKTFGYEQLVFRVGIKPSRSFSIEKLGYVSAFLKAKEYLTANGFECHNLPHPKRHRDLILRVKGEFGYRSILREFKHEIERTVQPESDRPPLAARRRKL